MAPITPIAGPLPSQSSSISSRRQTTLTSTQNAVAGSTSTTKPVISSISAQTVHVPDRTITEKSSTTRLSTITRASTTSGRSTSRKPVSISLSTLRSNPPSVSLTSTISSSTSSKLPIFSAYSPGGNHPNYSTILPPISQGQHGTASSDGDGSNTSTIIAGVLVPLILIGVLALSIYIWYRRKYPVRMVLGRDFNRFSNPAYNKRASTVTLVRNDEPKDWDTICRKNPDLSIIKEDEPDGIENQAFDSENEENDGIRSDVNIEAEIKASTSDDMENRLVEETVQNEGIRRERPKTKKAILVKTRTMEDFENGFELVTESDLGQRTESEISSGNDSTETHTISLTFSETFDDRHRTDQSNSDISEIRDIVEKITENNHEIGPESITLTSTSGTETIGEHTAAQEDNYLDDTDMMSSQSNESFEILSIKQDIDRPIEQQTPDGANRNIDTSEIHKDVANESVGAGGKGNLYDDFHVDNLISASPSKDVMHVPEKEINIVEDQEKIQVNIDTDQAETVSESQDSTHLELGETEQILLDELRHDTCFEKLSHSEGEGMSFDQLQHDDKKTDEGDVNILEKEKTEVLEKDKTLVETNELLSHSLIDDKTPANFDAQNIAAQTKLPSLQLSNENIVFDSDPQSPTLVQESFILENESPLPVFLDSTHMSPRRGRRAFTLNDIAFKNTTDERVTSEFSLPNLNDEKSKSSPVISELKNSNFAFKQFEFESKYDNIDQSNNTRNETTEIATHNTCADQSEEQNQVSDFHELLETDAVDNNKDNKYVTGTSESTGSLDFDETFSKIPFSDKMLNSSDSNDSEFSQNKSDYFDDTNNLENNNYGDFDADPFSIANVNSKAGNEESTKQNVNIENDGCDKTKLSDVTDIPFAINNQTQEKSFNEISLDARATEDNLLSENFPQSSTPTASFVMGETPEESEDLKRKKLLPQSFDFGNFDDTESLSSNSSSENSEIQDSPTSTGRFPEGTETFSNGDNNGYPTKDKVVQRPVESFAIEDMLSLTKSTESSTTLSWEVLSRQSSQDSRSADHLDVAHKDNEETAPDDLEVFADNENDSFTNLGQIDFNISDLSIQCPTNNTSIGSSATTDISWEIVDKEGDNSEC